jgi:hypothetical protein
MNESSWFIILTVPCEIFGRYFNILFDTDWFESNDTQTLLHTFCVLNACMVLLIPIFIDLYMIIFKFIVITDKLKAMFVC